MSWLCHLMDPGYLYSRGRPAPGPGAVGAMLLIILLGIALAWWTGARRRGRGGAVAWAIACLLLGLTLFLSGAHWGGLVSARIIYLAPITLGVALPLLAIARARAWPAVLRAPLAALACELHPHDLVWPWWLQAPWLVLVGGSLYVSAVHEGRGWGPFVIVVGCLVAAAAAQGVARRRAGLHLLRSEVLTPLLLPMGAYAGRWLGRNLCRIQMDDYIGYPWADPLSPWLDAQAMLYAGLLATALTTGALAWRALRGIQGTPLHLAALSKANMRHATGVALLVLGLGWYLAMASRHLSHGVTGSDPFCYVQMAIDLAEQRTALHRFPLAELGYRANLASWPLVPVGYHPPRADGWSATVWPIGWPALLAPWYRLGGEGALLWTAPIMVILAVLLTWACARSLWPENAWLVGGLAGWLLLTSREVVWHSLVPMADGAAMALVALAMAALWRAQRPSLPGVEQGPLPQRARALCWSAVAGLAIGMAYFVRHPLLPLLLAALPLLLNGSKTCRWRVAQGLTLGCATLLVALPDLQYHASAFGSPWIPESPESGLLSWRHIGSGLLLLVDQGLLGRHEFGFVLPLILYGVWQVWRSTERPQTITMVLGFGGVLLFGLLYSALRLRDLLALFPFLALWAGRGLAGLWAYADRPDSGRLVRRAMLLVLLWAALGARSSWTLQRLQDSSISTFGYLSAPQRRAFDQLATLVPENAVLACGLGAGAVAHYTGRDTLRPASWSEEQFQQFADLLALDNRPLYVIEDGTEMADWLARARADGHSFTSMSTLNLPTFAAGGEPYRLGATIYRLERGE